MDGIWRYWAPLVLAVVLACTGLTASAAPLQAPGAHLAAPSGLIYADTKPADQSQVSTPLNASSAVYEPSVKALFELFIIAVILEQALALIFNWKLFREKLDGAAVKPVISFGFACGIVWIFNIDILADLLQIYTQQPVPHGVISGLVTALVLGGGSSAVNNLMIALGLRPVVQPAPPPRPAAQRAWIAVGIRLNRAVGMITIIGEDADGARHSLGTVTQPAKAATFMSYFLQNPGRFPPSGGRELTPGIWILYAEGRDQAGGVVASERWGPYTVDAGAIIDLNLTV